MQLKEENAALRRRGGNLFSSKEEPSEIARAIFDSMLPSKVGLVIAELRRLQEERGRKRRKTS